MLLAGYPGCFPRTTLIPKATSPIAVPMMTPLKTADVGTEIIQSPMVVNPGQIAAPMGAFLSSMRQKANMNTNDALVLTWNVL